MTSDVAIDTSALRGLVLRPATFADVPFVMTNWLRTWRRSPWAGCIPNNRFHDVTRETINELLARGAKITVALLSDRLVAFLCHEVSADGRAVAHAGFAKDVYLGFQPLEALVEAMPGARPALLTFRTPQLERALGDQWTHAPEVARRLRA